MKTKDRKIQKKKLIVIIVALVLLAAAGVVVALSHSKQQAKPTVTPMPSGAVSTGQDTSVPAGPSHDATPSPTILPSNPAHPATSTLAKPTGPYDNLHAVSLTGANPPGTSMDSTCGSTAGVSCYIQATMGSQVIKVSQTKVIAAGAEGVDLPWDAKALSPGVWSIQAVATLGDQKALSDADTLTVNK